jgi:ABC-type multidrug transport system ATPase subunit
MNIIATDLGKRFNREWIFHSLSFRFESGKTYALVGSNGSGKSTLLQVLTGQMPASEGSLAYESPSGKVSSSDFFRSISIAAPYMDLIDEFTLAEMVNFHFRFKQIRGLTTEAEVMDRIGLAGARNKIISNFSSGMRQRLKLGLAFYSQSDVLFLDEPTTNLDKNSTEWYWQNLTPLLGHALIIIASNQEGEYPSTAEKIDVLRYKKGYNA